MRLTKLRELFAHCRHDPNYQHRDLPDAEFDRLAFMSFARLTLAEQVNVYKAWNRLLRTEERA